MAARFIAMTLAIVSLLLGGLSSAAQDKDKRSGKIIGELKSQKNTKDGKNTIIEVLAPGEEKARSYHVMYDAKVKGPIPAVLSKVRAAKVGDRVEFEWVETGHGPAITSFAVLRKGNAARTRTRDRARSSAS